MALPLAGPLRHLALTTFRYLPVPVRKTLVALGTPRYTVGAVCAIEHDGEVLFLRQPHRTGLSLPGGLLDRNEPSDVAVVREVREETGLLIEVGLPFATDVHPRSTRVDVIYRVLAETRPPVRVGGEAEDYEWVALADVAEQDLPTRQILATLLRTGGHGPGRVIGTVGD